MALTKITSRILDSSGVTTVGTISTGVWQGTAINQTYLVGQSGTNTGDETLARINALDITELGTISSGVWNGTAIASAYLDADTAHLSTTQTFTGAKNFSSNVGIGTSSPTYKLDVGGSSAVLRVKETNGTDVRVVSGGSIGYIGTYTNHELRLLTNGTEKLTISSTGAATFNSSSQTMISVVSSGVNVFQKLENSTQSAYFGLNSSGSFVVQTSGSSFSDKLTISSGGNVGIGVTPTSKLTLLGTSTAASNTPSNAIVDIKGTSTAHLLMGVANVSPYGAWINTDSTTQPLVLMGTGGNVGIGENNPTRRKLEIKGASAGIVLHDSDVTDLSHEIIAGGNHSLEIHADYNNVAANSKISFNVDGALAASFNDNGNLLMASGNAIFFGNSNNGLDAYEEGTWSALYKNNTGDTMPVGATTDSNCEYTRIGNKVYISGYIDTSGGSSVSGAWIVLDNLPFAPDISTGFWGGITIMTAENFAGDFPSTGLISSFSTSSFKLHYRNASDGGTLQLAPSDLSTASGASNRIRFHGFYSV